MSQAQPTPHDVPLYDVVAIGCGPFNLGLAALATKVDDLSLVVFESQPELRWHPGMMFDDAKLQLSFLADLVTLLDPTHPLSFLAYLQDVDRLYPFFIRESFHPTRREYEAYLRWAALKLPSIRFSHTVTSVQWNGSRHCFEIEGVRGDGQPLRASGRHLVIGIGTEAAVPGALSALPKSHLLHSSHYLHRHTDIANARRVSVVGSGQSGAEVALDLIRRNLEGGPQVSWLTRTRSFAPLDYSKLVLEMTTPEYIRYFHGLDQAMKDRLVTEQWRHYKGISNESLEQIHDSLYQRELIGKALRPVELRSGITVESAAMDASTHEVVLSCRHQDSGATFEHRTDLVVAATGYKERRPSFLAPIEPLLRRDPRGRFQVRQDYSVELDAVVDGRIFVANAELHTHGVATPDLGTAAYRNGTILNAISGREIYRLPRRTAFSQFELPPQRTTARVAASKTTRAPPPAERRDFMER